MALSPILAIVDLSVASDHREYVTQTLSKLPNVLELYEARGECNLVSLVSAPWIEELWDFIDNIVLKTKRTAELTPLVLETDKGPMKKEKSA